NVWNYGIIGDMSGRILFDQHLFWALFQAILFIDTLLFTLGYIIETPALKNRIVSVEATFLGWFVCLACYPPWNGATSMFLDWNSNDFPHFDNDTIHLLMNCCILLLMGIYSWASVALGFRASNLTNRGIVTSGPYRFIRHPAYVAKNTAWWIGSLPFIYLGFSHSFKEGMWVLFCRCAWSFLYAMRAITEERHLRLANNGYAEYARKVRWRFIPGLI
ncbi:MAG: isoprenylcysteine carboxyl methyltransferase, partial [Proteobacteria bacterium]|nr:isoprenylcysteine carboxyl methyltransferase [Pseudomonadota bacterium]